MALIADVALPGALTGAGDLARATGLDLMRQRILRGLWTSPGDLVLDEGWGAGLDAYQGLPADPILLLEVQSRIERFLDTLAFVLAYKVTVTAGAREGATSISLAIKTTGGDLSVPDLRL